MGFIYVVLSIIGIAAFFIFPLYVGMQAWRKNARTAAILLYLSIIFLLGFPVALIVFFVYKIWQPNLDVSPRLYHFFGCGTAFYGATERADDGSFLTTEWFIVFQLPIVPIQSYRVSFGGTTSGFQGVVLSTTKQFYIQSNEKLSTVHVLRGYALLLGFFLLPGLLMSLIFTFPSGNNPVWALPMTATVIAYIVLMVRLLRAK